MELVKSKERVKSAGEVFTPDNIVNDMLDLTDDAYLEGKKITELYSCGNIDKIKEYIDSTYLEPSCGNGNFLIRILDRKLEAVYMLDENIRKLWILHAFASIYGVDIADDNIAESKKRMIEVLNTGRTKVACNEGKEERKWYLDRTNKSSIDTSDIISSINSILDRNIQLGNTLTGQKLNGDDLYITEYKFNESNVIMSEFAFSDLEGTPIKTETANYNSINNRVIEDISFDEGF